MLTLSDWGFIVIILSLTCLTLFICYRLNRLRINLNKKTKAMVRTTKEITRSLPVKEQMSKR